MQNPELFRAVFVRHGHTKYTNQFPDITERGRTQLSQTAQAITFFSSGCKKLFFSSPTPRAMGSAHYLAQHLKHNGTINESSLLAASEIRDPKRVHEFIAQHGRQAGSIERSFFQNSIWQDYTAIETPRETRQRLYRFLSSLVYTALHRNVYIDCCLVIVSHFEILCHLPVDMLNYDFLVEEPLRLGEPTFLTFHDIGSPSLACANIVFRQSSLQGFILDASADETTNP